MKFIKKSERLFIYTLKRLCLALLLLTIAACSNMGKKDKEKETESTEGAASQESQPFVLIPNPYLPGVVPEPAKLEYANIKATMQAKKWEQAKGLLELMAATYPSLSGPYVNLGIVHHALGEMDEAEKALKYAIEVNPQNLGGFTRLGVLYRELGRFNEAEAIYLKALNVWPHHLPSAKNIGILYDLYMGRFDDALVYYELSQNILGGEDRQLKGWIIDLKRRMKKK